MEKEIVGAVETVTISELNGYRVHAKIDTGAKSSSLHCDMIRLENGMVFFEIHGKGHSAPHHTYELPAAMIETVRSSNGIAQQRIFVKLTIEMGRSSVETLVSLTDRSAMKYPMLIGRRLLAGRFLVDCSHTHLVGDQPC